MRHLVATMFDFLQSRNALAGICGVLQNVVQGAGTFGQILGNIGKHAEKFLFPGDQSHVVGLLLFRVNCKKGYYLTRPSERQQMP